LSVNLKSLTTLCVQLILKVQHITKKSSQPNNNKSWGLDYALNDAYHILCISCCRFLTSSIPDDDCYFRIGISIVLKTLTCIILQQKRQVNSCSYLLFIFSKLLANIHMVLLLHLKQKFYSLNQFD
jgi:hypothetical protein